MSDHNVHDWYIQDREVGEAIYDADYFLRGKESGKSLYSDYRWMPELTVPMVLRMIDHLGIEKEQTVLDFGSARGYVVRAFRELGYEAYGIDLSSWAVGNCDQAVKQYLSCTDRIPPGMDWVIAKDVLEHVPQVADKIDEMMTMARAGVFAVVPLSRADGASYVVEDYEKDVTHVHRLTLASWVRFFARPGWVVEASYAVHGIKQNYAESFWGNGFITARRT